MCFEGIVIFHTLYYTNFRKSWLPLPPLFTPSLANNACSCCLALNSKPSALPCACKHAGEMGMLCLPSLLKSEGEGGGGATIIYNILWPAKVPNAWRNIPLQFCFRLQLLDRRPLKLSLSRPRFKSPQSNRF